MRRISICLFVPFVLACGLVGPDDMTVHVQGQVTAADDSSPIVGALAEVSVPCFMGPCGPRAQDSTDAQGQHSLSFVKEGSCEGVIFPLVVRAQGFAEKLIWFNDHPHITCTEELQIVDVRLTRLPT